MSKAEKGDSHCGNFHMMAASFSHFVFFDSGTVFLIQEPGVLPHALPTVLPLHLILVRHSLNWFVSWTPHLKEEQSKARVIVETHACTCLILHLGPFSSPVLPLFSFWLISCEEVLLYYSEDGHVSLVFDPTHEWYMNLVKVWYKGGMRYRVSGK